MELEYYIQLLKSDAYIIIFIGLILENTLFLGFIVPGITLLMIGGYFVSMGELNFILLFIVGVAGTLIGDNVSYILGRKLGNKRSFFQKIKKSKRVENVINYIKQKHINKLYFFHFPFYLRTIVPFTCGFIKFDFNKWIRIDFIGAILFNIIFALIGYITGKASGLVENAITIGGYFQIIFIIGFALLLVTLINKIIKRQIN